MNISITGQNTTKSGFTLIELSLVIVMIGLIVSGIIIGSYLIKAAEIRSVIKDLETYKTAINSFKLKYNCLPGDCNNATTYFGAESPVNATCIITASTGLRTCNGNGNGQIQDGTYEMFRFWQHLAIAGMISGQYTGIAGSTLSIHHILGTNAPAAAIAGSGFGFSYLSYPLGDGAAYGMNYGHIFWFGIVTPHLGSIHRPQAAVFTPAEAYAFDQKIDDGRPAKGMVIMKGSFGDEITWGTPDACSTSISATDYEGEYNTSSKAVSCAFMIKSGIY